MTIHSKANRWQLKVVGNTGVVMLPWVDVGEDVPCMRSIQSRLVEEIQVGSRVILERWVGGPCNRCSVPGAKPSLGICVRCDGTNEAWVRQHEEFAVVSDGWLPVADGGP